jgi:hypothetical protein
MVKSYQVVIVILNVKYPFQVHFQTYSVGIIIIIIKIHL